MVPVASCRHLLLLLYFSLLSLAGASDVETILTKIRTSNYWRVNATFDSSVQTLLDSQNSDGSWSDIDYASTAQTNWPSATHYARMGDLALAYVCPTSGLVGNADLYNGFITAAEFYYNRDTHSTNWWYEELNEPQGVLKAFVYMRGASQTTPELQQLETAFCDSYDAEPNPTKHGLGANRMDVALWHLFQALLRDNHDQIVYAVEYSFNSLVYTTDEGIQHDTSNHAHGPQNYIYGYGSVFVSRSTEVASYLSGTQYAMPTQYLDVYRAFMLGGYNLTRRGQYISFSPLGRGISRANATKGGATWYLLAQDVDPAMAAQYDMVYRRGAGLEEPGYGITPSHTQYYRTDYVTHNRPGYNFTIATSSTRTSRQEMGNGENLKGRFLSDGATNILLEGDEYYNIFPYWDWTKIPGTTTPTWANTTPPSAWGVTGTSVFTGGVTNGAYGASTYVLDDYGTTARKSWFCFDDEVVCLGAGLASTDSSTITTTLNQARLDGEVVVSDAGSVSQTRSGIYVDSLDWIWHDRVGYFFPSGGEVHLSTATQTGNWYDINTAQVNAPVSGEVFKLWFDHGISPTDGSYAYIVAPGIESAAAMIDYDRSALAIASNTDSIQAVYHRGLDILQAVFYSPGTLVGEGFSVEVTTPCAISLRDVSSTTVVGAVADPAQTASSVTIRFANGVDGLRRQLEVSFPQGDGFRGASVEFAVDGSTPIIGAGNELLTAPVADTYARDGIYAATTHGDLDTLVVENSTVTEGDNCEVYLRFPPEPSSETVGIYTLRLHTDGSGSSLSAYEVADDTWEESSLTWTSKPARGALIGTKTAADGVVEWDVTEEILATCGTDDPFSVALVAAQADTRTVAFSREHAQASLRPVIAFFPLTISRSPELGAIDPLGQVVLTVAAASKAIACQWYRDDSPVSDTARIQGATSPQLTIAHFGRADQGNYVLKVTLESGLELVSPGEEMRLDEDRLCLIAVEDGYCRGGDYADVNYGHASSLVVKLVAVESYVRESYVKFDLSTMLPADGEVLLRLHHNQPPSPLALHSVQEDNWDEDALTWNNAPAKGDSLGMQIDASSAFSEWDVSSTVTSELIGDEQVSFCLRSTVDQAYVSLDSIHNAAEANRPQLVYSPDITVRQSQTGAITPGDMVALSLAGAFQPYTCQWYRNGIALQDGARVAGTDTYELGIQPLTVDDEGFYQVQVTVDGKTFTSAAIQIELSDTPVCIFEAGVGGLVNGQELLVYPLPDAGTGTQVEAQPDADHCFLYWENAVNGIRATQFLADYPEGGHLMAIFAPNDLATLPDEWKRRVVAADASITDISEITDDGDLDGDGITNLEEVRNGTDALVYNIPVFPGWNLIHLPRALAQGSVDLDELFGEGARDYWCWSPEEGAYTRASHVAPGTGVWVCWTLPSQILELPGERIAEITLDILPGWNLIGVPFPVDVAVFNEYTSALWSWDAPGLRYNAIVTGNLESGVGYWLFAVTSASLTIQAQ